jgi:hypothetical protein
MPGIILSCKTFGVLSPLYEDIPFPGPLHDLQQVDARRRTALIHVLSRLPHRRATSADRSRPTGRMITPTLGSRFSQGGKGPRTANCLAEEATTIFGSGSLRAVQDSGVPRSVRGDRSMSSSDQSQSAARVSTKPVFLGARAPGGWMRATMHHAHHLSLVARRPCAAPVCKKLAGHRALH